MANPAWPGTLPAFVMRPGYGERPGRSTIETPVDAGPPKVRRRVTADVRRFAVAFRMTSAQFATFEAFWRDDLSLGSLAFDWVHPRTRAAATLQFRDPHWSLAALPGPNVEVTLNLERIA